MSRDKYDTAPPAAGNGHVPLKIGFLLLDRFTLTAFSAFVDAIRLAADRGGRSRQIHCAWSIMGSRPVRSSCGLTVLPEERLGRPERFDYIAVCGGNGYLDPRLPADYARFLHKADAKGVRLIGVCTGTFNLAEAGLLDGHLVCVHWNVLDAFQQAYPWIGACSDRLFIDSGPRITCAGSVGSADLAMFLVRRHCGPERARQAARHMMLHGGRPGDYPQPHFLEELADVTEPVVRRAALLMEQSMNEFRPVSWFAERVGVSVRQLERRFKRELGLSPAALFRKLRLDYAASLLQRTDLPVFEIAIDCGFVDSAHLARDFRERFAMSPTHYRIQARQSKPTAGTTQDGGGRHREGDLLAESRPSAG